MLTVKTGNEYELLLPSCGAGNSLHLDTPANSTFVESKSARTKFFPCVYLSQRRTAEGERPRQQVVSQEEEPPQGRSDSRVPELRQEGGGGKQRTPITQEEDSSCCCE